MPGQGVWSFHSQAPEPLTVLRAECWVKSEMSHNTRVCRVPGGEVEGTPTPAVTLPEGRGPTCSTVCTFFKEKGDG